MSIAESRSPEPDLSSAPTPSYSYTNYIFDALMPMQTLSFLGSCSRRTETARWLLCCTPLRTFRLVALNTWSAKHLEVALNKVETSLVVSILALESIHPSIGIDVEERSANTLVRCSQSVPKSLPSCPSAVSLPPILANEQQLTLWATKSTDPSADLRQSSRL